MDKDKILLGDIDTFVVTIDRNKITEIRFRDRDRKYLYQNGEYVNNVTNIKINKLAVVVPRNSGSGLRELINCRLIVSTMTKDAKNSADAPVANVTEYYDVPEVWYDTAFLDNQLYVLHNIVDFEKIHQLLKKNTKIVYIDFYYPATQYKYNTINRLASYLFNTNKYDVVLFINMPGSRDPSIKTSFGVKDMDDSKKIYIEYNVYLSNDDRYAEYVSYKKRAHHIFSDETFDVITDQTKIKENQNTVLFVPSQSEKNSSEIKLLMEHSVRWDVFTNCSNYKSQLENNGSFGRIAVIDDTAEQKQFAACMLYHRITDRVIVLTDDEDNANDKITIYRNKKRASFLV